MCRYQHNESRITIYLVDIIPPKETNKAPIIDPQKREIYELFIKELRIILFKKFSESQEHTDKQNFENNTQIEKQKNKIETIKVNSGAEKYNY